MKRRRIAGGVIVAAMLVLILIIAKNQGNNKMTNEVIKNYHTELFGENVYIFSPEDNPEEVNEALKELARKQEANQFGEDRYALYFMPGEYDSSIEVTVGFYMQAAGLGEQPTDTKIPTLRCLARWLGDDSNHNATCNFWRGVENMELESNTVWAVSQATFMRRMSINGKLSLHDDYGWASGGFLSDSKVLGIVDSGTQQQWLSRNCSWKGWNGDNWNIVFAGIPKEEVPKETWPQKSYTDAGVVTEIREKPFLIYEKEKGFEVFVPDIRTEATDISWEMGQSGRKIPIDEFYVAKPSDIAADINQALEEGKNLFLTPGIYQLEEPIRVTRPDTIVLGSGLSTIVSQNGNPCMETADVPGIILAGILFDAGKEPAGYLLSVGGLGNSSENEKTGIEKAPVCMSDMFFRVGGAAAGYETRAESCVIIESSHVIGDNLWVWRADHGSHVGWTKNEADIGIIINGDDVTMYALMVEHFKQYQTVWNGNHGKLVMYQCEIPYDIPSQEVWMSHDGTVDGYASIHVDDTVSDYEAYGIGIYLYNRDAAVNLHTAMEVPDREGVKIHNICTVMITGNPGISHIINDTGESVTWGGARAIIREYENGIQE